MLIANRSAGGSAAVAFDSTAISIPAAGVKRIIAFHAHEAGDNHKANAMITNTCRISLVTLALLGGIAGNAMAAGHLLVEGGWIRSAPPGAAMLAGYGTLHNIGDAPVV